MKTLYISFFFCLSFLTPSLFSQDTPSVPTLISNLEQTDSLEKNIQLIFQTFSSNPEAFLSHREKMSETLNPILSSENPPFLSYLFALELANAKSIQLTPNTEKKVLAMHKAIRENLKQDLDYETWMWEDSLYSERRYESGVLLDLMGHFRSAETLNELQSSLQGLDDARLKFFAVKSLIAKGEKIDKKAIGYIAAKDETRGLLFDELKAAKKIKLFPKEYISQKALSKSDMVNWLIYPTELGRAPTEIELIQTFEVEYTDVGAADFYLWKYRSDHESWKDDGWMVGLSGPFVRKDSPSTDAYGYTFSAFSKLEEKTPQEHFDEIIGILEKSYENNQ